MLSGINEIIKRYYPMCEVRLNHRTGRYEVHEEIFKETIRTSRRLWEYENEDGTHRPCIADKVIAWLKRADTRNWPMQDRIKVWDKEDAEELERAEKKDSDLLQAMIIEDYDHIAGIKTFFQNPAFHYTKKEHPMRLVI